MRPNNQRSAPYRKARKDAQRVCKARSSQVQRIWSRPFLFALSLSLLLHFSGIALFRFPKVDLLSLGDAKPVSVDSRLFDASAPATESAPSSSHARKPHLSLTLLAPRTEKPALPSLAPPVFHDYLPPLPISSEAISYSSLQPETSWTKPAPLALALSKDSIQLCFFGPVAQYAHVSFFPKIKKQVLAQLKTPILLRFAVELDTQTGQLLLWDCSEESKPEEKELLTEAEHLLKQLRFTSTMSRSILSGGIELTLLPEKETL